MMDGRGRLLLCFWFWCHGFTPMRAALRCFSGPQAAPVAVTVSVRQGPQSSAICEKLPRQRMKVFSNGLLPSVYRLVNHCTAALVSVSV